ncbi:MAG: luciferase family protein [Telluria sp.]
MQTYTRLPQRQGPKPTTTPSTPHQQLDQTSPPDLQDALWLRMLSLAGTSARPSGVSVQGTRALWLDEAGNAAAFMVGREFAHLHPAYDGSLHMTLDPQTHAFAMAGGWAEPHPLAGRFAPATTALIYGPRDEAEVDLVWWLVQQSHRYARGLKPDLYLPMPARAMHAPS